MKIIGIEDEGVSLMKNNFTNRKSLIFQKQKKNSGANTLIVIITLVILLLSGISSGMTLGILNKPVSQPFNEKSTNTTVLTIATIDEDIAASEPTVKSEYQSISLQNAQTMLNENQNIVVIDARSSEEYKAGHIEKALSIPFSGCDSCFIYKTQAYQSKIIIVYGEDDKQSSAVCEALVENSFEHVFLLEGGFKNWQNNGFPLATDKSLSSGGEAKNSTNVHALGYVPPKTELKNTTAFQLLRQLPGQLPRYGPLNNPPPGMELEKRHL